MRFAVPLSVSLLCACAPQEPAHPVTMSTQGSTAVRSAVVVNVRNSNAAADIGGAVTGGMAGQHVEQSGANRSFTELTVRFDNGDEHTYSVESEENFRIGDPVKVTSHNAIARITHLKSAQP